MPVAINSRRPEKRFTETFLLSFRAPSTKHLIFNSHMHYFQLGCDLILRLRLVNSPFYHGLQNFVLKSCQKSGDSETPSLAKKKEKKETGSRRAPVKKNLKKQDCETHEVRLKLCDTPQFFFFLHDPIHHPYMDDSRPKRSIQSTLHLHKIDR